MNKRIYLSSPHMSDEGYEKKFTQEAFDTNWIAPLGKNVDEFENELAFKVGIGHAVALSSGTAAIHMGLKAAGVGKGDKDGNQNKGKTLQKDCVEMYAHIKILKKYLGVDLTSPYLLKMNFLKR